MQSRVRGQVPMLYVRSVEAARRFYALFGYGEVKAGGDGEARWSYLQCGEHTLLLACVRPALIQVELPLLIYLFVTELETVRQRLGEAGHPHDLVGYPDHAPDGEIRTQDPDGNVVLVGQQTAVTGEGRSDPTGPEARFSLIRQAAEAVSRRGGAPASCQIGTTDGRPCSEAAEVKLADTWGSTVWGCLTHADEARINAPGTFIATEDARGLGPWLARRATPR
ncbi:hypothetical protein Q0Z83_043630 [Actinoplanes sichuanensis]|uniref:VOC family protein n=2 Tax=Actinoplanes sichuanensis TaxID=512349 RepID=A0ABW4AUB4_9ACTN|nr:hypothetical protein Q0Z83_043630 [Actinoplanes sichuanensis]